MVRMLEERLGAEEARADAAEREVARLHVQLIAKDRAMVTMAMGKVGGRPIVL